MKDLINNLANPNSILCRKLSKDEVQEFRNWAKTNYKKFNEIKGIWHPIVQFECVLINAGLDSDLIYKLGGF